MIDQRTPRFLVMHRYHLSRALARETAIRSLQEAGVKFPELGWDSLSMSWKDDDGQRQISFRELIEEARLTVTF